MKTVKAGPPPEASISAAIRRAIEIRYPGAVTRKRHQNYGINGDPDVYGCLPGGLHFEIEVKRPGNEATLLQLARLAYWHRAGAIAGVAHSVEEALQILIKGRS